MISDLFDLESRYEICKANDYVNLLHDIRLKIKDMYCEYKINGKLSDGTVTGVLLLPSQGLLVEVEDKGGEILLLSLNDIKTIE